MQVEQAQDCHKYQYRFFTGIAPNTVYKNFQSSKSYQVTHTGILLQQVEHYGSCDCRGVGIADG
jgi:hypothetical protein